MRNADPGAVLSASVLVLNRFYMAVHVVSVRRAFCLLFSDSAEVIHLEGGNYHNYGFLEWCEVSQLRRRLREEHDDFVRTVHLEIQAPRIIRLLEFDSAPRQTLRFSRRNLFARDGHRCQYCGKSFPLKQLSLDHVIPRSQGGATSWENVVCSCLRCNTKKGGRTPQQARMTLRTRPAKPKHNPLLASKLGNPKYASWRTFLPQAHKSREHA